MKTEHFEENRREFKADLELLCDYERASNCPTKSTSVKGKSERLLAENRIIEYVGLFDIRRYYNVISEADCRNIVSRLLHKF